MMEAQKQLQLCLHTAQSMFAGLPSSVQRALLNPYVQKSLALLVALRLVKGLSGYLSRSAQNNWLRVDRWDPNRELVVLTGGCSGIGKQIMEDLSKTSVTIAVLDIKEPGFSLRGLHFPCGLLFWLTLRSLKCLLLQDGYHVPTGRETIGQPDQEEPWKSHRPDQQCRCRVRWNYP